MLNFSTNNWSLYSSWPVLFLQLLQVAPIKAARSTNGQEGSLQTHDAFLSIH